MTDIPNDIAETVLRMGRAEWGAIPPKDDSEHASDFADSLRMTREHFSMEGPQRLHGAYLDGTDVILCHTGTSPNAANNARAIVGAWNWLFDAVSASATEARSDATGTGAAEGESAAAESRDAHNSSAELYFSKGGVK